MVLADHDVTEISGTTRVWAIVLPSSLERRVEEDEEAEEEAEEEERGRW